MNYCVLGGAGFIGSHLSITLLQEQKDCRVVVYDNFSSGQRWHLEGWENDRRLKIVNGDIKDINSLEMALEGAEVVYHFASNPDISKAAVQPDIDFWEGTYLTNNVLEAMRKTGVRRLFYASGSGIYGDTGLTDVHEDYAPLLPISTYGASKLACEALIASYCHMFDMSASAFRFANVVGPKQTHGVAYDFVKRLSKDPGQLLILGNGTQSKSYIYISDVVRALRVLENKRLKGYSYFNVSTLDHINVTEIARVVIEVMNLEGVQLHYTGGDRGWKGDVPVVRLSSNKIRSLGWENQYSAKEAIRASIGSIVDDAVAGRFKWE